MINEVSSNDSYGLSVFSLGRAVAPHGLRDVDGTAKDKRIIELNWPEGLGHKCPLARERGTKDEKRRTWMPCVFMSDLKKVAAFSSSSVTLITKHLICQACRIHSEVSGVELTPTAFI